MANDINMRLYRTYYNMKTRCNNTKSLDYQRYGWRWIKLLWNTYEDFVLDMYPSYIEWLTLERIDNDWNYCKINCKRADRKEQANNTRRNHLFEYLWQKLTLTWWAELLWIKRSTLAQRIYVYKRPIEKTLVINP